MISRELKNRELRKSPFSNVFLIFQISVGLTSCSLLPKTDLSNKVLLFTQDVEITHQDGSLEDRKANEVFALEDRAIYVNKPGHIGILIVPETTSSANISVRLMENQNWGGSPLEKLMDDKFSEAMERVTQIQRTMASRQWAVALSEIGQAKEVYPYITYFSFLEAGCYIMLGNKEKARSILKVSIGRQPSNVEANDLYKKVQKLGDGQ